MASGGWRIYSPTYLRTYHCRRLAKVPAVQRADEAVEGHLRRLESLEGAGEAPAEEGYC